MSALRYGTPSEVIMLYGNDPDQPTRCPNCGSRTEFIEAHGQQLHWCLNDRCKLVFRSEDEKEDGN